MQATVHTFDPSTLTGSVITDDGVLLPFDAAAFATGGLRLLRVGQRLTVEVAEERVTALRIVGIEPVDGGV
jgi:2-phospho-L-lactate guanylyltransferase